MVQAVGSGPGAGTTPAVTVAKFDNATTYSDGKNTAVWYDKNRDGVLNNGDVLVVANRAQGAVDLWTVGEAEGSGAYGDPHARNNVYDAAASSATLAAFNALIADGRDGVVDNAAGLQGDMLIKNAKTTGSLSFQDDMIIQTTTGAKLSMDVVPVDNYTINKADLTLTDNAGKTLVLTLGNVWVQGGVGADATVTDTTNRTSDRAVQSDAPTFYELDGANLSYRTMFFGADYGTSEWDNVVAADGDIRYDLGKQSKESVDFYDKVVVGSMLDYSLLYLGEKKKRDSDEQVGGKLNDQSNVEPVQAPALGQVA